MDFSQPASDAQIAEATEALTKNGFTVLLAADGEEAKRLALAAIPQGAQVMTMSSQTLIETGIRAELDESGKWDSVRAAVGALDDKDPAQHRRKQQLGAAPEWSVGSVHAITRDGHLMMASASGSQIPAHSAGADHVLLVAGTQKIVADLDEGMRRIKEYTFPLESIRAMKAYGKPSAINQMLIINAARPGRVTVILIKQNIGF